MLARYSSGIGELGGKVLDYGLSASHCKPRFLFVSMEYSSR